MPDRTYWAKTERDGENLTITVHMESVSNAHPNNFVYAALGLAQICNALCIPSEEARTVLEGIARERHAAKAAEGAEAA